MNTLIKYSKYLIDEYDRIAIGSGGRCMSDLIQFYETGSIKELLTPKSSTITKIHLRTKKKIIDLIKSFTTTID